MNRCEYCKEYIEEGYIRCDSCNFIWNEGVKFGESVIKTEFRIILNRIKGLLE